MKRAWVLLIIVLTSFVSGEVLVDSVFSPGPGLVYNESLMLNGTVFSGVYEAPVFDAGGEALWSDFHVATSAFGALPDFEEPLFVVISNDFFGSALVQYHLDESFSGLGFNIDDTSGQLHDGISEGNLTCGLLGAIDGACLFGSNDSISVPNTPGLQLENNVTYAFWINATDDGVVFDRGGYTVSVSNGSIVTSFGSGALSFGSWHHVGIVYQDGIELLYIDGVLLNSTSNATLLSSEFSIGGFSGMLDEFVVFDGVLNESMVAALYVRGAVDLETFVRTCSVSDCSDSVYAETLEPNASGQYLQYLLEFSTLDLAHSVLVYNVSAAYSLVPQPPTSSGGGSGGGSSGGGFIGPVLIPNASESNESESIAEENESVPEIPIVSEPLPQPSVTGFLGLDVGEDEALSFIGFVVMLSVSMFGVMWFTYLHLVKRPLQRMIKKRTKIIFPSVR